MPRCSRRRATARRRCARCRASSRRGGEGPPPELVDGPRRAPAGARSAGAAGTSTSSACSIRRRRSSSRAAARGTARSAAPGPSTAAATGGAIPERIGEELARIHEPGVFIVDDVAFIQPEHGFAIGAARSSGASIRKKYYLETRGDVLLRNNEVFRTGGAWASSTCSWASRRSTRRGCKLHRKRVTLSAELRGAGVRALAGRHGRRQHHRRPRLGRGALPRHPRVGAVDPGDRQHQRQHALPGHRDLPDRGGRAAPRATTACSTSSTPCCRRKLPLDRFYDELVKTQQVLNTKHLGSAALQGHGAASRPSCSRAGRPTSCACSGSSTASSTRRGSWPTTRAR